MKLRDRTWVGLIIGVIGAALLAFLGLFAYITFTSTPLHPDAARVPSVQQAAPGPQWAGAAEQARQSARASVIAQNLPGLSIAVGVGGDLVWAEGFGWADLDKRVPVAPRMRFRIGTASTALTSAGVGLLLEKQKLRLDDEIQTYVPEFPKKQWPVTVRQLMGHVAGLGNDSGDEGPLLSQHCQRPVEALPAFSDRALLFQPATQYRFSRYSFILVSAAIESAAAEPFLQFMRQQVFQPLGMHDTKADSASSPAGEAVTPYFPRFAADTRYGPDPMRDVDYSCYAGSSAFVSTPSDLVRFAMAINGGKLLRPATVHLLQAPQRLSSGEDTGYGLGWDLETVALAGGSARVAGHDGDLLGGMVSSFMTLPDGTVVAVTSNTSYADTAAIALDIARIFADQGEESWARPPRLVTVTMERPTPGGITWTIAGERLALLAWPRAILLQVAHPLIAAGVARHSSFRSSRLAPFSRLHATVGAMRQLTFGTDDEAAAVVRRILAVHDRVNGALPEGTGPHPRGTRYSAHDPALLLWVHATLLDSHVRILEPILGPFTPEQRDAYCREAAPFAVVLGAASDAVPRTWPQLQAFIAAQIDSGRVTVGADARMLAAAILHPPFGRLAWPLRLGGEFVTVGSLPPAIREGYGFAWNATRERRRERVLAALRTLRGVAPAILARWPEARRAAAARSRIR